MPIVRMLVAAAICPAAIVFIAVAVVAAVLFSVADIFRRSDKGEKNG